MQKKGLVKICVSFKELAKTRVSFPFSVKHYLSKVAREWKVVNWDYDQREFGLVPSEFVP